MDLELKFGLIQLSMRAGLKMVKDIFLEHFYLLMEANMSENFVKIRFREKAYFSGKMEGGLMDFGQIVR